MLVASVGNILGSIVNWFLGRGIERFGQEKWFPIKEKSLNRATKWYAHYGRWTLLLSWMPIIGDPLTIIAGVMREKLGVFIALVTVAKTGRFVVVNNNYPRTIPITAVSKSFIIRLRLRKRDMCVIARIKR